VSWGRRSRLGSGAQQRRMQRPNIGNLEDQGEAEANISGKRAVPGGHAGRAPRA
jgi:hypothetical protein